MAGPAGPVATRREQIGVHGTAQESGRATGKGELRSCFQHELFLFKFEFCIPSN